MIPAYDSRIANIPQTQLFAGSRAEFICRNLMNKLIKSLMPLIADANRCNTLGIKRKELHRNTKPHPDTSSDMFRKANSHRTIGVVIEVYGERVMPHGLSLTESRQHFDLLSHRSSPQILIRCCSGWFCKLFHSMLHPLLRFLLWLKETSRSPSPISDLTRSISLCNILAFIWAKLK